MSDDNSNPEVEEVPKSGGGNKMILILAAVNVLALAGAGAAMYVALTNKPAPAEAKSDDKEANADKGAGDKAAAEGKKAEGIELAIPPGQPGPLMDMDPFVVNLDETGSNRYLKIKFSLELAGEPARPYLEARMARIRDKMIAYLSSLNFDAVRGQQGKTLVRDGVHERIAEIAPGMVTHVFITDFVVQ